MRLPFPTHFAPAQRQLSALTLAAIVFGLFLGTQWRSFESRPTYASRYSLQLSDAVLEMQREHEQLKSQLAALRAKLDALNARSGTLGGEAADLKRQIDALAAQAGLVPLEGSGVTVTLDDAKLPANAKDIARAIIHSQDITDVFNAAWKGGAEAIAINGERITGTSACVGAVIQINGALMSPPFVFSIIGPPERLLAAFGDPAELSELKERSRLYGLGFALAGSGRVRVPAYTGPLPARYAHPR